MLPLPHGTRRPAGYGCGHLVYFLPEAGVGGLRPRERKPIMSWQWLISFRDVVGLYHSTGYVLSGPWCLHIYAALSVQPGISPMASLQESPRGLQPHSSLSHACRVLQPLSHLLHVPIALGHSPGCCRLMV